MTSSFRCDPSLKCATKILNFYSTKNDQVFINLNDLSARYSTSLLDHFGSIPIRNLNFELNSKTEKPYLILDSIPLRFHPTIFVVFIENNLQELKYLRADIIWNSKAKFILITGTINFNDLVKFIKENFIENFVVIKNGDVFGSEILNLSLFYSNPSNLINRIGDCVNVTGLFPERFYGDFKDLNVRACFMDVIPYAFFEANSTQVVGLEINLLDLLTKLMGFNLTFVESPHPFIYHADTRNAWDILTLNKTDIFFGKYKLN